MSFYWTVKALLTVGVQWAAGSPTYLRGLDMYSVGTPGCSHEELCPRQALWDTSTSLEPPPQPPELKFWQTSWCVARDRLVPPDSRASTGHRRPPVTWQVL